ncbi:MAG: methyl-accepting chemotaxis protein [Treponema sp.]|jgi:iron only hydrogenase large subunit-like protein|nr:methyl-accepting chemotaxis protein [Treponema sp.]
MGSAVLTPVVKVDEEKCSNCYVCITACPVKLCIDGSGDKLEINPDLCIGCGNCIAACTRGARQLIDDSPHFFGDLKHGEKMIAVVAPAIASVFPGEYLNVNGFLKSLGIEAVFDVSFGAELTVVSYLDYINKNNPRLLIAQPCPAIVNYIEIYQPKLLPYLAPAESPMLHTIKMIREFYPQYEEHKIAVISPCIAKRREFDETQSGDYNVTMVSLKKHLESNDINLASFPAVDYVGPEAEVAAGFSSPGGLLDTAECFIPGIRQRIRKIEGVHSIYPYLEEMAELLDTDADLSMLVDCLNCEKGCNGGPGTGNSGKPLAVLEDPIRKRIAKLESHQQDQKGEGVYKKQYQATLNKYWKKGLYDREYRNLEDNNQTKTPSEAQLTEIYHSMKKFTEKDFFNCTSCGYGSCETMASAIFNNLNKPEKCAHYNMVALQEEQARILEVNEMLKEHIDQTLGLIGGINRTVSEMSDRINLQSVSVNESSVVTKKMVVSLNNTSALSREKHEAISELIDNANKGRESMRETIKSVQGISDLVDGIAQAIKIISAIAANTNLLSMNAAIEAAHAGEAGRGFAVVADEIRRLSETTRQNSRNISQTLSSIIDGIAITSKRSSDTDSLITEMSREINGFAKTMLELLNTFSELSAESAEIIDALNMLSGHNAAVEKGYAEVLSMTEHLRDAMINLAALSADKVSA